MCDDDTQICTSCYPGFSGDPYDRTKCNALSNDTPGSKCPDRTYAASDGKSCPVCSSPCSSCNGPTENNCTACASGMMYMGNCAPVGPTGVCAGTNGMIANNLKKTCDSENYFFISRASLISLGCGKNCTECIIENYEQDSTMAKPQLKCKSCLFGSTVSNGTCKALGCPDGQFDSGGSCIRTHSVVFALSINL
jgi:hypothetical protein